MCEVLSEAERDLAVLADTDLDIEPLFAHNPETDPPLDTNSGKWARGEVELELVAATEKQIAYLHAVQARALARYAAARPGQDGLGISDFVADEIGLAVHWTTMYAGSRLALAFTLTERLPATLAALARGDIDLRRAQRLAEITAAATPAVARAVEDAVLPEAIEQNSAELARAARKTLLQLDPDGAAERHQERKKDRRVELNPLDDAMAELRAYLTAPEADRIYHTINTYAQAAHTPGDTRTADQRRADTLCDLILHPHHHPTTDTSDTGDTGEAASADETSTADTSGADTATGSDTDTTGTDAGETDTTDSAGTNADTTTGSGSTADTDSADTDSAAANADTTTGSGSTADTDPVDAGATSPSTHGTTGSGSGSTDHTDTANAGTTQPHADAHDPDPDLAPGTASATGTPDAATTTNSTAAGSTEAGTAGNTNSTGSNMNGAISTSTTDTHPDTTGSDTTTTGASGETTTGISGQTTTQAGGEIIRRADGDKATRGDSGTGAGRAGGPRAVSRPAAQVQVTVPLTTLLGLDNQPADLAGYGPIHADLARELAADGVWRRLVTDPLSGALLDYGRTTYRPPAALADFVRARDRRCVFPGCGRKATCCDLDHTICYPDGPTSACNLACLCRRHHRLKHESDWTLHRDGDQFIWTAPTGLQYVRKPEPLTPPAPPSPPPDDEPPPF